MGKSDDGLKKKIKAALKRKAVNFPEEFKREILAVFTRRPNGRIEDITEELDTVIGAEIELQRTHPNLSGAAMKAVLDEMTKAHAGYQRVFESWKSKINW